MDRVAIPRCKAPEKDNMSMHHGFHMFAGSSKTVAAAAVYLRTICEGNTCEHPVAARTYLHSKSEMSRDSMPCKKIIALGLGARLSKKCFDATSLKCDSYELWSDSRTVIQ